MSIPFPGSGLPTMVSRSGNEGQRIEIFADSHSEFGFVKDVWLGASTASPQEFDVLARTPSAPHL